MAFMLRLVHSRTVMHQDMEQGGQVKASIVFECEAGSTFDSMHAWSPENCWGLGGGCPQVMRALFAAWCAFMLLLCSCTRLIITISLASEPCIQHSHGSGRVLEPLHELNVAIQGYLKRIKFTLSPVHECGF